MFVSGAVAVGVAVWFNWNGVREMDVHLEAAVKLMEAGRAESNFIQAYAHISIALSLSSIAESVRTDTRDFFAASALQGILSGPNEGPEFTKASLAAEAYRFADAMMQARDSGTDTEAGGVS